MRIIVRETPEQATETAENLFRAQLTKNPESVLGLATGSTPIPLYEALVRMKRDGLVDFSRLTGFNLDEYAGLGPDHPQSYSAFMRERLFSHIGARDEQWHIPNGKAPDPEAECERYEAAIEAAGGIDLQILGIGRNGHIGFNEPADDFPARTRLAELSEDTLRANRRFFEPDEEIPGRAFTMGVGTIFRAKEILLMAFGQEKADAVARAAFGKITPRLPASILQLHPCAVFLLDREAASGLPR